MDPLGFLVALRRRWLVVAASVAVAVGVGMAVTTMIPAAGPSGAQTYSATTVLLNTGAPGDAVGLSNLKTIARLATMGEVSRGAAAAVDSESSPETLASRVQATPLLDTGMLNIVATGQTSEEAVLLSRAFAKELVQYLGELKSRVRSDAAEDIAGRVDSLQQQLETLDERVNAAPPEETSELRSQMAAKKTELKLARSEYASAAGAVETAVGLRVIDTTSTEDSGPAIGVPPEIPRLFIAGFLGLLAGLALAVILEKMDTRIRSKEAAERHFALPVLAEIAPIRRRDRRRRVVTATKPTSSVADDFRLLAAGLSQGLRDRAAVSAGQGRIASSRTSGVFLVTSPGAGEGKTIVVANLAAAFAEVGNRVLVLSCDLRNPKIHELLGTSNDEGLTQALTSEGDSALRSRTQRASLADLDIALVPSGPLPTNPSEALSHDRMRAVVDEARAHADVVLIDSAPVLHVSDTTLLLGLVDGVLLVSRGGQTRAEDAERASELLRRFRAPLLGVVLNCATETGRPRGAIATESRANDSVGVGKTLSRPSPR